MTNCVNCGAILHGNKCEYCGTEYEGNRISASFSKDDYMGVMKLGNETIYVYIEHMEGKFVGGEIARDINGTIHSGERKMKRIFTVVEI